MQSSQSVITNKLNEIIPENISQKLMNFKIDDEAQEVDIPNILHFIWHGSVLQGPQKHKVEMWRKSYPNHEINVWFNSQLLTQSEIAEFKSWAHQNNINLLDTNDHLPRDKHCDYETSGPFPNYGARSDIERWTILKMFGGIYLDTDIAPTEVKLPEKLIAKHGILFNQFSQGIRAISNDIIACAPNNRLATFISEQLHTYYNQDKSIQGMNLFQIISSAYGRTINKSGPTFLRQLLYHLRLIPSPKVYEGLLSSDYEIDPKYFDNNKNDLSWLEEDESGKKTLPCKDYTRNIDVFIEDLADRTLYDLTQYRLFLLKEYLESAPMPVTRDLIGECFQSIRIKIERAIKASPDQKNDFDMIREMLENEIKHFDTDTKLEAYFLYAQLLVNLESFIKESIWKSNTKEKTDMCLKVGHPTHLLPPIILSHWMIIQKVKEAKSHLLQKQATTDILYDSKNAAMILWKALRAIKKSIQEIDIESLHDEDPFLYNYLSLFTLTDSDILCHIAKPSFSEKENMYIDFYSQQDDELDKKDVTQPITIMAVCS